MVSWREYRVEEKACQSKSLGSQPRDKERGLFTNRAQPRRGMARHVRVARSQLTKEKNKSPAKMTGLLLSSPTRGDQPSRARMASSLS